uniref:Conserved repeat domain n=1 Tax=Solibacter usitatus (strain Ellin6076) TaxID=234267 RepID=Q02BD5_SOLUE
MKLTSRRVLPLSRLTRTGFVLLSIIWSIELADAQIGFGSNLVCNTAVAVTPTLRGEGYAELTGDIVLNCTGGTTPPLGSFVPQVNITVFYNTAVTSRLLPITGVSNNTSESLLIIDEPGSGPPSVAPGFGPSAAQSLCATPLQGCVEYVSQPTGSTVRVATDTPQGTTATIPGKNVFQGIVNGNSVTFFGIPVLPSASTNARVLRITNVRINATQFNSAAGSLSPVQASISITGAISLLLSDPSPYVGFVAPSLTTSAGIGPSISQCASPAMAAAGRVSFAENFVTAFKTRVMAQNDTPHAGQNGTPGLNGLVVQNVPGVVYDSESNFVMPIATGQMAGLADFGTRLKATFNNVPAGVRLFVSVSNVQNSGLPVPVPAVAGGSAANTATAGFAQLTSDEGGAFSPVAATALANSGNVPVAEIAVVGGSATAVWEVVNTNPNVNENLQFAVYTSYIANPGLNSPVPGITTVNLSYAASPPNFTVSSGASASDTLPVPRFVADLNAARGLLAIVAGSCSPQLSISKVHSGNFTQGQNGATYTLVVNNAASAAATSGLVTVTDTLPAGLTAVAMSGSGWSCNTGTLSCTRGDPLTGGSVYSPIAVTVNVAPTAGSLQINQARVFGPGFTAATTSDSTIVTGTVTADSVTPASGSGLSQTFSLRYSDSAGTGGFSTVWAWFNAAFATSSANSCMFYYAPAAGTLYLLNDPGTQWMPGTLGSGTALQNSACFVNLGSSNAVLAANTLTLNLALTFQPAYAGTKNVYVYGSDAGGGNSGWQTRGTWTVPAVSPVVTADGVIPDAGSGSSQMFALQYSDTGGAPSLSTAWVWFNETFAASSANSCMVYYDRAASTLYLLNDPGTQWLPGTFGNGLLQNSQCSVYLPSSSAVLSGGTMTLHLAITFKPAYAGWKNIYMYGAAAGGNNSGWQTRGTWTAAGATTGPSSLAITCPSQVTPGGIVACSLNLWNTFFSAIDTLAVGVTVTPNGSAPALTGGQIGFSDSSAVTNTGGTANSISLSWSNAYFSYSSMPLGSLAFVLPASAAAGQSYSVAITSASASAGGNPVTLVTGAPATLVIPVPGQPSCSTNVTVTPNVRGEGSAEQVGDITLSCTGGAAPPLGAAIPQTNITVFFNTAVTSRLLPVTGVSNAVSEALLLIDEPGSGLPPTVPGFGPAAPQNLCATPLLGCLEYVSQKAGSSIPVATDTPQGTTATTPGKNVFQGIVNGNSVTFFGVPVLSPGPIAARVYRITNLRVNATPLFGGSNSGAIPVQASISISGAASLGISNSTPVVGFVTSGLTGSAAAAPAFNQCNSQVMAAATTLSFAENFGTAFKTRVAAQNNSLYAGQNGTPGLNGFGPQNVPGGIYNSESSFVVPVATGQTVGLSDYGTRLRAQFNNVPAGVRLFVSVANVLNSGLPVPTPAVIGGSAANTGNNGFAQLTSSETGPFSAVAATTSTGVPGGPPLAEIPVVNGSATAVWEVINTNPNTNENFRFAVYASYTANPAQNLPAPGTATVNLSYASAPPSFTPASGANASDTLPVPRFVPDLFAARNAFTIPASSCVPSMSVIEAQSGNFTQGQLGASITIAVNNISAVATNGGINVTDVLPSGLTLVSMAGTGWNCTANACSRGDALSSGTSYPAITVTVNVAGDAPSSVSNLVMVSGGGDPNIHSVSAPISILPALPNLASGKQASQSSTFNAGSGAEKAIDGNVDGNSADGSTTQTNSEANAWWQVDLGASATVSSITIWNRTDCCGSRLGDYWVFLSDTPFAAGDTPATLQSRVGTWSSHQIVAPNPSTMISGAGQGRYLRIQLSGTDYLSLAEVQVAGNWATSPGSVTFAPASQSATIGTQFGSPLQVTVKDTSGNPLNGVTVMYSAPATGSSATLSGTAITNTSGIASVTATANGIAGTYPVAFSAGGQVGSFSLTNLPQVYLSASPNASAFGAAVTMTAQVTPSAAAGRVTFYDGTTVLGTSVLSSGMATLSTLLLPAGTRTLRAYYSGGPTYGGNTSNVVTHAVNAGSASFFATFPASPLLPVASQPVAVAPADFNGDGKIDLAVGGEDGSVRILRGNGDGTYQPPNTYWVGTATNQISVTVGDFNGDGKPDVAVADGPDRLVTILLGNGDGTLRPGGTFAIGAFGSAIATGDFNGDGKPDLVVTNGGDDNLSIFLGNGDGTFQAGVNYATIVEPVGVVVGDFNGDGKADLAVSSFSCCNNVSVLLGNGDGTFHPAIYYAAGQAPWHLAIGDFNRDGKLDLAVADYAGNSVNVLLGNGDGTFQTQAAYPVGSHPYSVAVGDFNGDGKPDLAVPGVNTNDVSILSGNGDGTFQPAVSYPAGSEPYDVAVADLNRDGRADLILPDRTGDIAVLLGTTAGISATGGSPQATAQGSPFANPLSVTLSDQNGNPLSGVIVVFSAPSSGASATLSSPTAITNVSGVASVTAMDNNTPGSYTITARVGPSIATTFSLFSYPAGTTMAVSGGNPQSTEIGTAFAQPLQVTVTNAAHDPIPGVPVSFTQQGTGFPSAILSSGTAITNASGVASVTATASNLIGPYAVIANVGALTVSFSLHNLGPLSMILAASPNPSTFGAPVTLTAQTTGCFSGGGVTSFYDGTTMLATKVGMVNPSSPISTILLPAGTRKLTAFYSGDNAFCLPSASNTVTQTVNSVAGAGFLVGAPISTGGRAGNLAVADFNGDGKADLAFITSGAFYGITVQLGNGDGTFRAPVNIAFAPSAQLFGLAVGDFNHDGKPDLTVSDSANSFVAILTGNGDGTFQPEVDYAAGTQPSAIVVGDFNFDGMADIATVSGAGSDGSVSVLLGKADGSFAPAISSATGTGADVTLMVADFNGDGKADVAVGSFSTAGVNILLGKGDGSFLAPLTNNSGWANFMVLADLNGDGRPDLVGMDGAASAYILLSNGNGTFQPVQHLTLNSVGPPDGLAVGDFNGDGRADLAVSNFGGGVQLFAGNGNGTFQQAVTYMAGAGPGRLIVGDFNGDGRADIAVANSDNKVSLLLGSAAGLGITSTHLDPFGLGLSGETYSIVVSNRGSGASNGAVTVAESLPTGLTLAGMTGSGWTCPVNGNTCTRNDSLAGGASYPPITATVNVGSNAPSLVVNSVTVASGSMAPISFSEWTYIAAPAVLSITTVGDAATVSAGSAIGYTISVQNSSVAGTGAASAAALSDALPAGTGINWTISPAYNGPGTCAITGGAGNQILACSFGTMSAGAGGAVHIVSATSVSNCAAYTNTATATASNAGAVQATGTVTVQCPGLGIVSAHNGSFTAGQTNAAYRLTISNGGSTTSSGTVTVTEALPNGLTLVSMAGTDWTCPVSGTTCSRNDALSAGASYPPVFVSVSVAANALSQVINRATVVAGNSAPTTATDPTAILPFSSTALAVTPTVSTLSQVVTLTATVTAGAAGKVTFYNGTSVLGVGTLSGGQATSATRLLGAGNHTLHAHYRGDATHGASDSLAVIQTTSANPASGFQAGATYSTGREPHSVTVGDLNRDGKTDLVIANFASNNVSVLLGSGDGTFQPPVNYAAGTSPQQVEISDFDSDGKPDLAVIGLTGSMSILLGNGDGTFQSAMISNVGALLNGMTIGDFNGDGNADIALADTVSKAVSILLGNGDGTFQSGASLVPGGNPEYVAAGDFDGDGRPDLAVTTQNPNAVVILLGNGDGSFRRSGSYVVGSAPWIVLVGDWNGDGKADLAISNQESSSVSVLLGNGDGSFSIAVNYAAGLSHPGSAAVGDFNGDGKLDLIVESGYSIASLAVLFGNGDGTFQPPAIYDSGGVPTMVAVGDFNGDGRSDIAGSHSAGDNVTIMVGAPPAILSVQISHSAGFFAGQNGATCTVVVSNAAGASATSGAVTVTETMPAGLYLMSMAGAGWTCNGSTSCTRNDVLPAGSNYPPITVTVNVPVNATSPQVNQVSVSGGGSLTAIASDSTNVILSGTANANSVTPASGSGPSQVFALQYSDTAGASNLSKVWVWFTATFASSSANSCMVYYDRAGSTLYLLNDGASQWIPGTPGTAGTLQNSQCIVSLAGSSAVPAGNTLTLNLAMTFKPLYGGSKNVYMYCADLAGTDSGWAQRGTWAAPGIAVTADSVTPSGSGSAQTFNLQFSDTAGAANLSTAWVWFNATFASSSANSCMVYYDRASGTLKLLNDGGSQWTPGAPGAVGTLQNSQCAVNLADSSAILNGNVLTLNLAMTFKAAYAGAKNIYMYGTDIGGNNSGWQTRGTWIAQVVTVTADSVTPALGGGSSQTFVLQYTDTAGAANFSRVWAWFNATFAATSANSCMVYYDRAAGYLSLLNDSGSQWMPGTPGTGGTVQNSQCSVNLAGSSAVLNGNVLTLTVAITFKPAYAGAKSVYMYGDDTGGMNSGWQTRGAWAAPGATVTADGVTPASGSGTSQTFALQYSDTAGAANFSTVWVWFNATFAASSANSCMIYYDRAATTLYVLNDGGSQWMPGMPGAAATLQNSQCAVNLAGSNAVRNGNVLTLNLAMTFKPAYAGAKNIYLYGADTGGTNSGWQTSGTWTAPGTTTLTADSVTPASGSGATQAFALQYSDTAGAASLSTVWVWFNATFAASSANSCMVYYDRAAGTLQLINDAGTQWQPSTPGSAATLQNSQCSINLATTSVVLSSNTLTLNLAMTFKPVYAGAKNIYMYGAEGGGSNSGWQTRGGWTAP